MTNPGATRAGRVLVAACLLAGAIIIPLDASGQTPRACTRAVLTLGEAASFLRIDPAALERLAKQGTLARPPHRIRMALQLCGTPGMAGRRRTASGARVGGATQHRTDGDGYRYRQDGWPGGGHLRRPRRRRWARHRTGRSERRRKNVLPKKSFCAVSACCSVLVTWSWISDCSMAVTTTRHWRQSATPSGWRQSGSSSSQPCSRLASDCSTKRRLFAGVTFNTQENRQFFGSTDLSRDRQGAFGGTSIGVRRTVLKEGSRRPNVIATLNGHIPNDDRPYLVGAGLVLVKSVDPAALFFNANYFRAVGRSASVVSTLAPEYTVDLSVGYALALNDTLAINMAVSGLFTGAGTTVDNTRYRQPGTFSARFGITPCVAGPGTVRSSPR